MAIYKAILWVAWGLILYAYVLFPLALAVAARLFGRKGAKPPADLADDELPRVAMVVAAYNERPVMQRKLENTWALDYPVEKLTLYVGSDGSDDGTDGILAACDHPRLRRFLFSQRRGKISVLNELMGQVDAEIVVMSDAATMFGPASVRKLVAHFRDPKVGCVSGELSLNLDGGSSGEGLYMRYERWIKRCEGALGCVIGCVGAIFAIRPELYRPLPPDTIVEDFVIGMGVLEQGYMVRSSAEAQAAEPPTRSNREEMIRKVRIGAGNFQALAMTVSLLDPRRGVTAFAYMGHKVLRWLVPFFLFDALVANVAVWSQSIVYAILMGTQLAGIAIAAWAYRAPAGEPVPRWAKPITYFYLMNLALFMGFFRFMLRAQRVTWERAACVETAI